MRKRKKRTNWFSFLLGIFFKKFYAVAREAVNFLESSVFGQLMGRPRINVKRVCFGNELFCRKFWESLFAYFLGRAQNTDNFAENFLQEFVRSFIL